MYYMRFTVWLGQLLIEDNSDRRIAASVVFGMYLGLTPVLTLQWALGFVLACLVRFNVGSLLASTLTFWGIGNLLEGFFHALGLHLLTSSGRLIPLWTWMYHAPIVPFTEFNHTTVMGATVFALLFSLPLYVLVRLFLKRYRTTVYHAWRTTKLYRIYVVYKQYAR